MQVLSEGLGDGAADDESPLRPAAPIDGAVMAHGEVDSASGRRPCPPGPAGKENCAEAAAAPGTGRSSISANVQLASAAPLAAVAQLDRDVAAGLTPAGGSGRKQQAEHAASDSPVGDEDEPLSQQPLVQIRKQMLQSQQKRARLPLLARRAPAGGATPGGEGLLGRSSMPRAPAAVARQRASKGVLEGITDSNQVPLSQAQLSVRAFGQRPAAALGDGLSDSGCMQLSQVPLALWASKQAAGAACGDVATGGEHSAQFPLSQVPLAARALSAPGCTGTRTLCGKAERYLSAASQAARSLLARSSEDDRAAWDTSQHAAPNKDAPAAAGATSRLASAVEKPQGRSASWASSAAHLRTEPQRRPWLAATGDDEDPTEDLTLHQRQWVASRQHSASHGSSVTAQAALRAAVVPSTRLPGAAEPREGPEPAGRVPVPDRGALNGRERARLAAEEVVRRFGQEAAAAAAAADQASCVDAIRKLERELCSIAQLVSDPEFTQGVSDLYCPSPVLVTDWDRTAAPSADAQAQHADATASPALAMRNGGSWLPTPMPTRDPVNASMPGEIQIARSSHNTHTAAQQHGNGADAETASRLPRFSRGAQTTEQQHRQGTSNARSIQAVVSEQGDVNAVPLTNLATAEGTRLADGRADGPSTSMSKGDRQVDCAGTASHPLGAALDWTGAHCSGETVYALTLTLSLNGFEP